MGKKTQSKFTEGKKSGEQGGGTRKKKIRGGGCRGEQPIEKRDFGRRGGRGATSDVGPLVRNGNFQKGLRSCGCGRCWLHIFLSSLPHQYTIT
ncbi:hypothetical protein ABZP36_020743 [Zizania latifolia]